MKIILDNGNVIKVENEDSKKKILKFIHLVTQKKVLTRGYQPWTDDEYEQLNALYEQGKSIKEISSILQRTPAAVSLKIDREIKPKIKKDEITI